MEPKSDDVTEPLKYGARLICPCDIRTATHYLHPGLEWGKRDSENDQQYAFTSANEALDALAKAPPPPGWKEPKPEAEQAAPQQVASASANQSRDVNPLLLDALKKIADDMRRIEASSFDADFLGIVSDARVCVESAIAKATRPTT